MFPVGTLAAWQNSNREQALQGQVLAAAELCVGSAGELLPYRRKRLKCYAARLAFAPFIPHMSPRDTHFRFCTEQSRSFGSIQSCRRASGTLRGRGGSSSLLPQHQINLVTMRGVRTALGIRVCILLHISERAEKLTQTFHIYFKN